MDTETRCYESTGDSSVRLHTRNDHVCASRRSCATNLVHGGEPQRRHLLVVCCLHAELLDVLWAHWLVVKNHPAGSWRPACTHTERETQKNTFKTSHHITSSIWLHSSVKSNFPCKVATWIPVLYKLSIMIIIDFIIIRSNWKKGHSASDFYTFWCCLYVRIVTIVRENTAQSKMST